MSIMINTVKTLKQFQYYIGGIVEWTLSGCTVYSALKTYKRISQLEIARC
jgi:hypothetical protein